MQDVSNRTSSLRMAGGVAVLRLDAQGFGLLQENRIPQGSWREIVRMAGNMGAKHAGNLLPQCHQVQLDSFKLDFALLAPGENHVHYPENTHYVVVVLAEAASVGRVEVDMEVLTGLSAAVVSLIDLLKPFSEDLEVVSLRLLPAKGKKAAKSGAPGRRHKVGVLFCADQKRVEKKDDAAGQLALEMLEKANAEVLEYAIIPLDKQLIEEKIRALVQSDAHLVLVIGGTGPGKQDVAPDVIAGLMDKALPGLTAAVYQHGFERSSKAMLSSLVAGLKEDTVLLSLPGSSSGLREGLEAVLPEIFSFRKMIKGAKK